MRSSAKHCDSSHVMKLAGGLAGFEATEKHEMRKHLCSMQPRTSRYARDWATELLQCFLTEMPLLPHSSSPVGDNSVKKTILFRGLIESIFMLTLTARCYCSPVEP